ncbi:ABC-2 type transport system ATP-binding protein [Pseudomonas fluorescens]|uniref:ABC transporter ATP-binding protein n=1 Tax=Pseudomonas fluorescens TaxID=294 RepID=UPI00209FEFF5|nr:ABC transporter ATP-binding protein [Pseudomonas fluorescens]MCP1488452.1 ABC-2 type transport system ATP-binding protein [Pseudomonas fluorescens]
MIDISKLTKHFSGNVAVNNVSFRVTSGEVLGVLGTNGAGKSTTLRMLTGLVRPSSGTVTVCGFDICKHTRQAQRLLGYLPEGNACYGDMSVQGFLGFIAKVRGYHGREATLRVAYMLDRFELGYVRTDTIETLSKGYKRRIGLAQAMLHDPKVLILDEPTDGLDPNQKHHVRGLISELTKDKIVVISTHILEEVSVLCNRVLVVDRGHLLVDETLEQLQGRSRYHQAVTLFGRHPLDLLALAVLPGVAGIEAGCEAHSVKVLAQDGAVILPAINALVVSQGWQIRRQDVERGGLEEVFRTLTRERAA